MSNDKKAFLAALQRTGKIKLNAQGGLQNSVTGVNTTAPGYGNLFTGNGVLQNTGMLGGQNSAANQAMNIINQLNPLQAIQGLTQNTFQATGANIQPGTNATQLNDTYNNAMNGLAQQQNLVQLLNAQNGLGNQSNIYNQYGQIASGGGPNPAQAMLNQATGQNTANQAALMAGQRGAGANAGLIARQAAQQGAANQQNAISNAAQLQAQQQLSALGAQAGIAQNQVNALGQGLQNYNTAAQNEQNILQNANSAYNNANVSMQSNLNNVNGQISQGNQSASNNLMGSIMGGAGSMLSSLFAEGGEVGDDEPPTLPAPAPINAFEMNALTPNIGSANLGSTAFTAPGASAAPNIGSMAAIDPGAGLKQSSGGSGGGGGGLGGIMSLAALLAEGGEVGDAPKSIQSFVGKYFSGTHKTDVSEKHKPKMAEGGKVPALVSPGERYLSPKDVKNVEKGADPMSVGEKIPGKAKVGGAKNSYTNDTVPRTLDEGGIVLPRSVTQAKNPSAASKKFVEMIAAKHGMRAVPHKKGK